MRFIELDCDQRSPEWVAARLGRLTGSRAADMLATIQKGEAAARRNLRTQLVLERLTGRSQESNYQSPAMLQGIEREWDAGLTYEALTGRVIRRSGFLAHQDLMAGCSLDGHIGDFDIIVEAKCPIPATHLEYIETGKVPRDYQGQITHNLWITGARACDWFSYNPDFPEPLQMRLVRVERDEAAIADYEQKVIAFLNEVDQKLASLRTLIDLKSTLQTAAVA